MHEMAIVQSIIDILEQQAKLHNAKKIVRVSLEFGALTGVMPAAITFGFEVLAKGGIAEGAEIDINYCSHKSLLLGLWQRNGHGRLSTLLPGVLFGLSPNYPRP